MLNGYVVGLDAEVMGDDGGADSRHIRGCPGNHVSIVLQEGDEVTAESVL